MADGDLRTTVVTGARLICGWACAASAVLDLVTGFETGLYLAVHLVLLVGGLLLLARKPLKPSEYAVGTALAVVTTVVAALPPAEQACCMRGLEVRHGYPLTVLGWNHGQPRHFAGAHTAADLVFWFLAWMIVMIVISEVRSRGRWGHSSGHGTGPRSDRGSEGGSDRRSDRSSGRRSDRSSGRRSSSRRLPRPVLGGPSKPAGSDNSAEVSTAAPVADDESVGGLP